MARSSPYHDESASSISAHRCKISGNCLANPAGSVLVSLSKVSMRRAMEKPCVYRLCSMLVGFAARLAEVYGSVYFVVERCWRDSIIFYDCQ